MGKSTATKSISKSAPDYFKLPFEVHYSGPIGMYQMEFMSNIEIKYFSDIKVVHVDEGNSWGVTFLCDDNNGPELYCCITNDHLEVAPEWLNFMGEDNINFNYGNNFKVTINKDKVRFDDLSDEEQDEESEAYLDVDSMEPCCSYAFGAYMIGRDSPDYIVLDAEGARITVDLDGYVLDDALNPTSERIFNPNDLAKRTDLKDRYEKQTLWDAKAAWVALVFETDFPEQKALKLSLDSN